jgi:hypothetical protein
MKREDFYMLNPKLIPHLTNLLTGWNIIVCIILCCAHYENGATQGKLDCLL